MDNDTRFLIGILVVLVSILGLFLYGHKLLVEDTRLKCISRIADKSTSDILLICGKK